MTVYPAVTGSDADAFPPQMKVTLFDENKDLGALPLMTATGALVVAAGSKDELLASLREIGLSQKSASELGKLRVLLHYKDGNDIKPLSSDDLRHLADKPK